MRAHWDFAATLFLQVSLISYRGQEHKKNTQQEVLFKFLIFKKVLLQKVIFSFVFFPFEN